MPSASEALRDRVTKRFGDIELVLREPARRERQDPVALCPALLLEEFERPRELDVASFLCDEWDFATTVSK